MPSHWVPLSYGLVPHLSKKLSKFLTFPLLFIETIQKCLRDVKILNPPNCNCIKKENCPLKGRCPIECVVYKVEVLHSGSNSNNRKDKKVYVDSTQGPFKQRYYNHKSSFAHEIY